MSTQAPKAERLHWIKYNPNEWQGLYGQLTDEEYGLLHRIIARLWATPGNRLGPEDLLTGLRIKTGSKRANLVTGLIGYALKVDAAGLLYLPAIDDAFADALKRGKAGAAGASARWDKVKTTPPSTSPESPAPVNPVDF